LIIKINNLSKSEAALNYFLIQAFASTLILFSILLLIIKYNNYSSINYLHYNKTFINLIIISSLTLKIGAAPLHFWFINIIENLSWINNFILITWQKIAPMIIINYITILNINLLINIIIISSTIAGILGGLNQTSLRKLMAFSSINHIGWLISAIIINENIWIFYILIYSFINLCITLLFKIFQSFYLIQLFSIFFLSNHLKYFFISSILSLGGLPPFLGFLPKWVIINSILYFKINFIIYFFIFITLTTLIYYLKICFSTYLIMYSELNWNFKNFWSNKRIKILSFIIINSLILIFIRLNIIYLLN